MLRRLDTNIHSSLHVQVTRDRYRFLTRTAAGHDIHGLLPAPSLRISPASPFSEYISLYGPCHVIPEGGSNLLGVCGCSEILTADDEWRHDIAAVACGTGTTLAGLAAGAAPGQRVVGFPVLKGGGFVAEDASALLRQGLDQPLVSTNRMQTYLHAHYGGYAKVNTRLITFLRDFYAKTGVKLDPIYTGKLLLAIYEMAEAGELHDRAHLPRPPVLNNSRLCQQLPSHKEDSAAVRVLAIHTGGLQGVNGVELRLGEAIFPESS